MPQIMDDRGIGWSGEQWTIERLVGDCVTDDPAQLRSRPKISLVRVPEIIVLRFRNRMVLTGEVVNREAPGDSLLIERIRSPIERVRFRRFISALCPDDVLDIPEGKEISELGRVKHIRGADLDSVIAGIGERHTSHAIAVGLNSNGAMLHKNPYAATAAIRGKHGMQHMQCDLRLAA
jgi:hypothetical protein